MNLQKFWKRGFPIARRSPTRRCCYHRWKQINTDGIAYARLVLHAIFRKTAANAKQNVQKNDFVWVRGVPDCLTPHPVSKQEIRTAEPLVPSLSRPSINFKHFPKYVETFARTLGSEPCPSLVLQYNSHRLSSPTHVMQYNLQVCL